jgi:tetratricopeptide repeat protein 21B
MTAEALDALKRAKDLQKLVMNEVRLSLNNASTSSSEIMEHEKVILSGLCVELGDLLSSSGDYKGAETQYTEAIQHSSQNVNAMLGLARLFKTKRNVEQCIAHCRKIILFDAAHEGACILLSETLSQERQSEADDEAAALPLKELLAGHPNNYHALSSLITILRKMGYLVLANSYIEAAEKADRRAASHAGFRYCRGLYARAINDVGKAIHEFNFARKDIVWGENALVNMVELYLNPDQEGAWEERDESKSDETSASHIRIAEDLLKELKPICKDQAKLAILSNYCTFAHKDKASISTGISRFSDMVEENSENVSALLGLATGHMLEKNQPKALSVLKKISGLKQKIGFNEDFEKANLLLARLQIEKASTDTVEELCNACLSQNKSCAQAFELLGLMKEKNGDYEGASDHYYQAWKLEFEASAPTGFKLAFCLLKCRRCVEAVNICEKVLVRHVLSCIILTILCRYLINIPTILASRRRFFAKPTKKSEPEEIKVECFAHDCWSV